MTDRTMQKNVKFSDDGEKVLEGEDLAEDID